MDTNAGGSAPAARVPRQAATQNANLRPRINFNKLDIGSLRRYQRVHKLVGVPQAATKDQLVAAITKHFAQQLVNDEYKIITAFVVAVQRRQSLAQQATARRTGQQG